MCVCVVTQGSKNEDKREEKQKRKKANTRQCITSCCHSTGKYSRLPGREGFLLRGYTEPLPLGTASARR